MIGMAIELTRFQVNLFGEDIEAWRIQARHLTEPRR